MPNIWKINNPAKVLAYNRKYYAANSKRIQAQRLAHKKKDPNKHRERINAQRNANSEHYKAYARTYRANNLEKVRARERGRIRKKRPYDPVFARKHIGSRYRWKIKNREKVLAGERRRNQSLRESKTQLQILAIQYALIKSAH